MYYTVEETAKLLKVEPETIRKWIKTNLILAKKIGKKYLVYKNQKCFQNDSNLQ